MTRDGDSPFPAAIEARSPRMQRRVRPAAEALVARANRILASGGQRIEVREPAWPMLRAQLVAALDQDRPLPLRARMDLEGLLAWEASSAQQTAAATRLASKVANHYAGRRSVRPSVIAPLVEWAPREPAVQRLWSQVSFPSLREGAAARQSDWLRSLPTDTSLTDGLVGIVRTTGLSNDLPTPLLREDMTPLAAEVWKRTTELGPAWWNQRTTEELNWFLGPKPRASAFVHWVADAVLGPMAADLDRVRAEVAAKGVWSERIEAVAMKLPESGGRLDPRGLGEQARTVFKVWRLAADLADLFKSAWDDTGAAGKRRQFWYERKARIVAVERFEVSPWFGLCVNGIWFLEHRTGLIGVWMFAPSEWPEIRARAATFGSRKVSSVDDELKARNRARGPAVLRRVTFDPWGQRQILKAMDAGCLA